MKKLLFIHGFMGSPRDGDFLADLSKDLDVSIEAINLYETIEENIEAIKKISPSIIYGYSLGGRIALQYLKETNLKLDHLFLESSSFGMSDEIEREKRREQDKERAHDLKNDFRNFLKNWYSMPLWGDLSKVQKNELIEKRMKNNKDLDKLARQLINHSPGLLSVTPFERIKGPISYICGEQDKKYKNLAQSLKCRTLIVENSGHNNHSYHTQEILNFMKSELPD